MLTLELLYCVCARTRACESIWREDQSCIPVEEVLADDVLGYLDYVLHEVQAPVV